MGEEEEEAPVPTVDVWNNTLLQTKVVELELEVAKLEAKFKKQQKWARGLEYTLRHVAKYGYESVVKNREAECRAYREELAVRKTQAPCEECGLRADAQWGSNLCPYCGYTMGLVIPAAPRKSSTGFLRMLVGWRRGPGTQADV